MDTATLEDMGRELAARRAERGLSRTAVAEAVGTRPVVVARWERAEAIPSADQAQALVSVLGLPAGMAAVWAVAATPAAEPTPPPPRPRAARPWWLAVTAPRASTGSYLDDPREQRRYAIRWTLTLLILGALAILLVWAVGELSGAWRTMLDLLRNGPVQPGVPAAWLLPGM